MTEKDLVQEALQQMKNLEDVVQENAKGILGATMAQEISELVKESLTKETKKKRLSEQPEELPTDDMGGDDDELSDEGSELAPDEVDNMGMDDMGSAMMGDDDEVLDARGLGTGEALLSLYKKMNPETDSFVVEKDGDNIHIKDDENEVEYILRMNENIDEMDVEDVYSDVFSEDEFDSDVEDFSSMDITSLGGDDTGEVMYEITLDDDSSMYSDDIDEDVDEDMGYEFGEDVDEDMGYEFTEGDEVMYEITLDDDSSMYSEDVDEDVDEDMGYEFGEDVDEDMGYEFGEGDYEDSPVMEAKYMIKPVKGKMKNKGEAKENMTMNSAMKGMKKHETKEGGNYMKKPFKPTKQSKVEAYKTEELPEKGISNVKKTESKESKMSVKPKGVGMGSPKKFSYGKQHGGFKETMKKANPTMGTGKAKFEYKEAARTYGNGSKEGRGLRKGITNNRNYVYENETLKQEIEVLKEKNEEYRKALNVFREKLNEVAVFNSNLAYATRLFTEHSTSKTEKINILRRFDDVESLKESKSLYNSIKNELSHDNSKVVTESIERKIDKTASTGSATNLIESKTYENPQFLRMKDLMSKLTK